MRNATRNTTGMNKTILTIAIIAGLSAASTAAAQDGSFVEGRLLVKMSATGARSALPGIATLRSLDPAGAAARSADASATWFVADLEAGADLESTMDALANREDVEFVEPDYIHSTEGEFSAALATGDPNAGQQFALDVVEAAGAWQVNAGSKSVVVAVIDTGVQLDHPDLEQQIWNNTAETMNGIDDDGNGRIDDLVGWNFVSDTNNPSDDDNHGTHVAGIVAAIRGNNVGIAGAANVSIMPIKVLGADGTGPSSGIVEGIRYAMNNGATVINMSLTSPEPSQAIQDACNEAAQRDIVIVGAAGNHQLNTLEFPAGFDSVIAVGATDINDQLADFTNVGPGIEIVAPGVGILSTVRGSNYDVMDGTSMASPLVAGIAALIRSAEPNLTAEQVRGRLTATADDLGDSGYDTLFGHGRLNARRALTEQNGTQPTTPTTPNNPNNGGDDQMEDNDSMDRAQPIQPGTFDLMCNDEDWFKMEAPGYFAIEVIGNGGDLDLFVFDGNGEFLGSSESESSDEFIDGVSDTGMIYIAVAPYEGQTAAYTMTVESDSLDGFDDFGGDFGDDLGFGPDLGDNTLVVPVTCGVGAVQMLAAAAIGFVGLGATTRRKSRRNRR